MRFARTRRALIPLAAALAIGVGAVPAAAPQAASAAASAAFHDIANSYAKDDIAALAAKGIVTGTSAGLYEPDKAVTRAEFAALLIRLFGLEETSGGIASFQDVKASNWFYGAVQAASKLGLVAGTSASAFQPNAPVTREQAAVILVRALKLTASGSAALPFKDAGSISGYAAASVRAVYQADLLRGDDNGAFRPSAQLTRAEIAVLLNRVRTTGDWESEFESTPNTGLQLGWQYGQTLAEYQESVSRSTVNVLVPRVFFLESASSVTDSTSASLMQWAAANGKQVWGQFGNRFDSETTHALLASQANRQTVVSRIAALADTYGMDGVNLDFENVAGGDRQALTAFIGELAAALHERGAVLAVDVSPDLGTDWTAAFDYEAIGEAADYVVLMAYDEHWANSPVAGSVSSLSWLKTGLSTLLQAVPAEKTIVALPFYTQDWTLGSAVSSEELSMKEQNARIQSLASATKSWNAGLGQYVFTYAKSGKTHRIWTEDSRSLTAKVLQSLEQGAAGFAYWYIGAESSDVWPSLRNAYKYEAFDFG
ncbi:S-layer homology domain-containing protein [Cohnella fermenti]|uniref:Glycoside hydrolase n=1 Tax=Cohnella fermenti TaxID=2565925 RepID=A0A4S4BIM4_9BACL|nr:S-layer homology domain-containing protein [Cohnella fermenti]THF73848.1 glycoside hydrolase [Cohnella fermenti]